MKTLKFLFIFILFSHAIIAKALSINLFSCFAKKQVSPTQTFISKIKNATDTLIGDTLDKSKNMIYSIIGPRKQDIIDNILKTSAIAALTAITAYAIKKISDNKQNKQKDIAENNSKINAIIENFDFNTPGQVNKLENNRSILSSISDKKKWALWPNEMPFLELLLIPQEVLIQKLLQDIKIYYKSSILLTNTFLENIGEIRYLLDLFVKDLDIEISEYQKKYNIILISNNFDKKHACLEKIKDNIKKLIYIKSTACYFFNKQTNS